MVTKPFRPKIKNKIDEALANNKSRKMKLIRRRSKESSSKNKAKDVPVSPPDSPLKKPHSKSHVRKMMKWIPRRRKNSSRKKGRDDREVVSDSLPPNASPKAPRPNSPNKNVRSITSGFLQMNDSSVVIFDNNDNNDEGLARTNSIGTEVTLADSFSLSPARSENTVDTDESALTTGSVSECSSLNQETEEEPPAREYYFQCGPDKVSPEDLEVLKSMISNLTEEQIDMAAKLNFRYYRLERAQRKSGLPPTDFLLRARKDAAMGEAHRYLVNCNKKEKAATDEFTAMLAFKDELSFNEARFCFEDEPDEPQSREWQHLVSNYLGGSARAIVLNHDADGCANLYCGTRFATDHTKTDQTGLKASHGYMFERAIAATETKTNGKQRMINVVGDFNGFVRKKHAQPMFMLTELMKAMKLCYPEYINTIYLVDTPFIARFVFNIIKPLIVGQRTPRRIVMVNGEKERKKYFGEKYGPADSTDNIDMKKFYDSPFDKTWDDICD